MDLTETLQFTHQDRKDIYEYIESHGTVREAKVRRALNLDPGALGAHVAILERDGYIRRDGNYLQVAYGEGEVETHESDGVTFTIRQAGQGDLEALREAVRVVAEEGSYIEAESVADVIEHEEVVLRHNEVRSRMFFVATHGEDDDVVGWVHLDMPELEKLSHTAVLTVGIDPDIRGHGVGSALLERGMGWAGDNGFEKLYNSIPATNDRAIDFLSRHGWETEAIREGHYKIDGEYVDEVMMAVDLRSQ
jgi:ribosomal protein S18 acetylase RimI-like enzyme